MPSNKRTIYLGLDYSDFNGGITEVNRKMGLLDAEFKRAKEEAQNYGSETDKLGVKQEYLSQKIALQAQKVEASKEAYEKAKNSQTATAKQIDALNKKFIDEQTALLKLEGQLKSTDRQMDELQKDTKSFGDEIRGVASALGVNINPALEKLASKFDGVSAGVGNAVLGIGAMVGGLVACSKQVAQTADDLLTLSSTTGIATDDLQKLQYASNFVDVSVDTMTSSVTKLESSMKSARNGSKELTSLFKHLGVQLVDSYGHFRNANDVFYETIDALGTIKNETERDSVAMSLFGKSAKELNPLIEAGSSKLKELGIEAENLGLVLSGEDLAKAGQFNDALDRMKQVSEGLKNTLGLALIEPLTKLFDVISKIPVPVLELVVKLGMVVTTIVLVVKAIKSVTDTASAVKGFFNLTQLGASKTTLVIMGVVAALVALATIIAVIIGKGDDLNRTMNGVATTVGGIQGTVANAQTGTYKASNHATGTTNFKGGRTWVGEAGPELVTLPRGSTIEPVSNNKSEVNYYNITIDAKSVSDFNRVIEMAQAQKMALRRI